jgi:hypothetical protein
MYSGITIIYYRKSVGHNTVEKHTDVHIPARWKSRPLPLWGSSVPEHSVTRKLDRARVWKWPTTVAMAPEIPWHYSLWYFSLEICQRPGFSPIIATWPRWPKSMDHYSGEEYRCTHVDACVTRTWFSYRCVPCHPWCTHRTVCRVTRGVHIEMCAVSPVVHTSNCVPCHPWCTHRTVCRIIRGAHIELCAVSSVVHTSNISSCKRKNFFSFPVAVNNSIKVGPLVFFLNVCNHGEHYETPCISLLWNVHTGSAVSYLRGPGDLSLGVKQVGLLDDR